TLCGCRLRRMLSGLYCRLMVFNGIPVLGSITRMAPFRSSGETLDMAAPGADVGWRDWRAQACLDRLHNLGCALRRCRAGTNLTGVQRRDVARRVIRPNSRQAFLSPLTQFFLERDREAPAIGPRHAVDYDAIDVQVHGTHAASIAGSQPRVSAGESGLSSL